MIGHENIRMVSGMKCDGIKDNTIKYSLLIDGIQHDDEMDAYVSADGVYIKDDDGNRYIDLSSQVINVNIGYGNEFVIDAAKDQLEKLHYVKPYVAHEPRAKLCEKIIRELSPAGMKKLYLTLGGSDANDYAIRIAKIATGKTKILSQYHSYHGATIGSAQLSEERHRGRLQSYDFIHFFGYTAEYLKAFSSDEDSYCQLLLEILERTIISEDPGTVAAVFLETMKIGYLPPRGYYEGVRRICDKYEVLLIFDEVLVGFGRTGKWFAFEHYGVIPDMITFAKGVTSSYFPLGGVIVNEKVADSLEYKSFPDGLTAAYHPVGCSVADAVITYMQKEHIVENADKIGGYLKSRLEQRILGFPEIEEIRGIGLLLTIHMKGKMSAESAVRAFCDRLKDYGLLTWTDWPSVIVAPPLIINKEQADEIVDGLERCLRELENEGYLKRIRYYPDKSYEMKRFYALDFLKSLDTIIGGKKVLLMGSAQPVMMHYVLAAILGCNADPIIFISSDNYKNMLAQDNELLNEILSDKCYIFETNRFEKDMLKEKIEIIKGEEKIDIVLLPYSRGDGKWQNVLEVAKQFSDTVWMIDSKSVIMKL